MKPETALYQLKTMPEAFLRNNVLCTAGAAQSGASPFYIGHLKNPPTGAGAPNEAFKFCNLNFMVDNPHPVLVHNVRMIPKQEKPFDPQNIPGYCLYGGPDIMVTGQLSACTFVTDGNRAAPVVAHIQPRQLDEPALNGNMTRQALAGGRFDLSGAAVQGEGRVETVFGPFGDSGAGEYAAYAYVTGIRSGGSWQIWAQHVTTFTDAARITSVTRIL